MCSNSSTKIWSSARNKSLLQHHIRCAQPGDEMTRDIYLTSCKPCTPEPWPDKMIDCSGLAYYDMSDNPNSAISSNLICQERRHPIIRTQPIFVSSRDKEPLLQDRLYGSRTLPCWNCGLRSESQSAMYDTAAGTTPWPRLLRYCPSTSVVDEPSRCATHAAHIISG